MSKHIKDALIAIVIVILMLAVALVTMNFKEEKEVNTVVGVHVKGEVKKPGYYEFSYGSRVKDAIEKAGGATKNADTDSLNLAAKLRDGEEIIIPEKIVSVKTETDTETSPQKDSQPEETTKKDSRININTADISALCQLDGIGESLAGSIVKYREKHGAFKRIEDLKKVSGIGAAKFDKIKDDITI